MKIYTGPGCTYCGVLKRYLESKGIEYEELDALEHIDWLRSEGVGSLPAAEINGELVVGWYYIHERLEGEQD